MFRPVAIVLFLAVATARAGTPPEPEMTLTWEEGEVSRDMSLSKTTITLSHNKVHYSRRYSGRNSAFNPPKDVDTVVKDPAKLAAALAAFDKLAPQTQPKPAWEDTFYSRAGCLTRGKVSRCVDKRGHEPDAELTALANVRDALIEGLSLKDAL